MTACQVGTLVAAALYDLFEQVHGLILAVALEVLQHALPPLLFHDLPELLYGVEGTTVWR